MWNKKGTNLQRKRSSSPAQSTSRGWQPSCQSQWIRKRQTAPAHAPGCQVWWTGQWHGTHGSQWRPCPGCRAPPCPPRCTRGRPPGHSSGKWCEFMLEFQHTMKTMLSDSLDQNLVFILGVLFLWNNFFLWKHYHLRWPWELNFYENFVYEYSVKICVEILIWLMIRNKLCWISNSWNRADQVDRHQPSRGFRHQVLRER